MTVSAKTGRRAALIIASALMTPAWAAAQINQLQSVRLASLDVAVEKVAAGLVHPWALAFLPDGRMLVTERPGRLRIISVDGTVSAPLAGTPQVLAKGQGGLMDVALHPDFDQNGLVYLSFAEPGEGGACTALGRGRLAGERIEEFEVIFRQRPKVSGANHFGNRIVFSGDGHVFLTLGERFKFEPAQELSNHLGAIVRIKDDGSIPDDNPFTGEADAEGAIWSYGHRNIEAAAIDPATGAFWIAEMGPLGGDELNHIKKGANYGWPVVSWGRHYSGEDIPDPPTRPDFEDAALHWTPVISPSGMLFYQGSLFPGWRGDALIGSLSGTTIVRVSIHGETAREEERIPLPARIRDVAESPDGAVYLVTDEEQGELWRIAPLEGADAR